MIFQVRFGVVLSISKLGNKLIFLVPMNSLALEFGCLGRLVVVIGGFWVYFVFLG